METDACNSLIKVTDFNSQVDQKILKESLRIQHNDKQLFTRVFKLFLKCTFLNYHNRYMQMTLWFLTTIEYLLLFDSVI